MTCLKGVFVLPTMLILSLDYPPNDGGISRLASGLVTSLLAQGVEAHVVTFASEGRDGLPRPQSTVTEVVRRKGLRDLQVLTAVRRHLATQGRKAPVLASVWNPEATIALLAGAQRLLVLAHGNEVMPYGGKRFKSPLRRFVLESAHRVICNSRFTESLVKEASPGARTAVLNPAVEYDAFIPRMSRAAARQRLGLRQDAHIVLTVARLDPIKGHETVLHALARVPAHLRAKLEYAIVGKGPMLAPMQALAADLGVQQQVRFAGFVADDELPSWYAAADLFVLTSIVDRERRGMEGFGMAFTEAQAAGLPVIGTRSGGIPDAVEEGRGGWLIAEHDHEALAEHLCRLVEQPAMFREQGLAGQLRVKREHSWSGYAKQLLELI